MKVLHLITSLAQGGAERQLVALVEDKTAFKEIKHMVVSLQDEGVMGKQLGHKGVPLFCLNLHKSLKGLWTLWKILHKEKPDILQTWLYHADFLGLIIGKLARVPRIVWTIRCSNMDMSHYSRRTAFILKLLIWLSRFPDAVIANSQAGQDFHRQIGYTPKQWLMIPNGIDTEFFKPQPGIGQKLRHSLNIPEGALVVGMAGRVDPMKDHLTFLEAVAILSQEYENLYCLVAGKGTDTAFWKQTPPRFHCLGACENMPAFMNALDAFVLTSVFGEGFPNVVGEAMACGIPTIVTDVGDAAGIVQNSSQIVPAQSTEHLVLAIRQLLALSSENRNALGRISRERIIDSFSLSRMRESYERFYKSLI